MESDTEQFPVLFDRIKFFSFSGGKDFGAPHEDFSPADLLFVSNHQVEKPSQ